MCESIKTPNIVAGWMCHGCGTYNGLQRMHCKRCDGERCRPLKPDSQTGEVFETYEDAYKNNPKMLEIIQASLAREKRIGNVKLS